MSDAAEVGEVLRRIVTAIEAQTRRETLEEVHAELIAQSKKIHDEVPEEDRGSNKRVAVNADAACRALYDFARWTIEPLLGGE